MVRRVSINDLRVKNLKIDAFLTLISLRKFFSKNQKPKLFLMREVSIDQKNLF